MESAIREIVSGLEAAAFFTDEDYYALAALCQTIQLPGNQPIYSPGQNGKYDYLILKGSTRCYTGDGGKEKTLFFAFEGEAIGYFDDVGLHRSIGGREEYETLEESTLLQIDRSLFRAAAKKHPAFLWLENALLREYIVFLQLRLHYQLHTTAAERYAIVLEKEPHLVQRVPQHLLANYLGLTAETLSRVRAKR